jgi:hypothetical protein
VSDEGAKTPAYIGRRPCGCVVAAVVDDGDDPKDVAKFVAELVRKGITVERSTVEDARKLLTGGCKCQHLPAGGAPTMVRFKREPTTPFLPGFDDSGKKR